MQLPEELLYTIVTFLAPSMNVALINSMFNSFYSFENFWREAIVNEYETLVDINYLLNLYLSILEQRDRESSQLNHLKQIYYSLMFHPMRFYSRDDEMSNNSDSGVEVEGNRKEPSFLHCGQYTEQKILVNEQTKKIEAVQISFVKESDNYFTDECIRAIDPIPQPKVYEIYSLPVWYMEFTITDTLAASNCSIGLGYKSYNPRKQPGWLRGSVAYHGDDGGRFTGSGHHANVIERYGRGDTIGMGVWYATDEIFVTKNGKFMGLLGCTRAMGLNSRSIYILIGLWDKLTMHVNFGTKPFAYDMSTDLMEIVKKGDVFGVQEYCSDEDSDSDSSFEDDESRQYSLERLIRELQNYIGDDDNSDESDEGVEERMDVFEFMDDDMEPAQFSSSDDDEDDEDDDDYFELYVHNEDDDDTMNEEEDDEDQ
jgi:hypothetical protein